MRKIGSRLDQLVVVVPGILGSRLARHDRRGNLHEVWGTGFASLAWNLVTFGRRMKRLALNPDADPAAPDDGVVASGVITDLAIIPGFVAVKGYNGLIERLVQGNDLIDGQVVPFPYDWRLSCAVNGKRLASFLDEVLDGWRVRTGRRDEQAIIVAHSMGGLVSRWAIECEGAGELVARLFTNGTPYKGAGKALDALHNGLRLPRRFGPSFDELVWSLPSVRELLPTYPCIRRDGSDALATVVEAGVLPTGWAEEGQHFHNRLADAVQRHSVAPDAIVAFRGGLQPTVTSAALSLDGRLTMFDTIDGTPGGRDDRGDGTVPRDSSIPPEWPDSWKPLAKGVSQRHASMQLSDPVVDDLATILTDAPGRLAGAAPLGMRAPASVAAGQPFEIAVEAANGLSLQVTLTRVDASSADLPLTVPMWRDDDVYGADIPPLKPGVYEIVADRQPGPTMAVEPLSDYLVIFEHTDP
jgi:hypothetical protein